MATPAKAPSGASKPSPGSAASAGQVVAAGGGGSGGAGGASKAAALAAAAAPAAVPPAASAAAPSALSAPAAATSAAATSAAKPVSASARTTEKKRSTSSTAAGRAATAGRAAPAAAAAAAAAAPATAASAAGKQQQQQQRTPRGSRNSTSSNNNANNNNNNNNNKTASNPTTSTAKQASAAPSTATAIATTTTAKQGSAPVAAGKRPSTPRASASNAATATKAVGSAAKPVATTNKPITGATANPTATATVTSTATPTGAAAPASAAATTTITPAPTPASTTAVTPRGRTKAGPVDAKSFAAEKQAKLEKAAALRQQNRARLEASGVISRQPTEAERATAESRAHSGEPTLNDTLKDAKKAPKSPRSGAGAAAEPPVRQQEKSEASKAAEAQAGRAGAAPTTTATGATPATATATPAGAAALGGPPQGAASVAGAAPAPGATEAATTPPLTRAEAAAEAPETTTTPLDAKSNKEATGGHSEAATAKLSKLAPETSSSDKAEDKAKEKAKEKDKASELAELAARRRPGAELDFDGKDGEAGEAGRTEEDKKTKLAAAKESDEEEFDGWTLLGYRFHARLPSGNLQAVEKTPTDIDPSDQAPRFSFDVRPRRDCAGTPFEKKDCQWFYFSMLGDFEEGQIIHFRLLGLSRFEGMTLEQAREKVPCVGMRLAFCEVGRGAGEWQLLDEDAWLEENFGSGLALVFKYAVQEPTEAGETQFAYTFPYPLERVDTYEEELSKRCQRRGIYFHKEVIAKSSMGRDVKMWTFGLLREEDGDEESAARHPNLYSGGCEPSLRPRLLLAPPKSPSKKSPESSEQSKKPPNIGLGAGGDAFGAMLSALNSKAAGGTPADAEANRAEADSAKSKYKQCIFVSARVHPGETPASFMLEGLVDFFTSKDDAAQALLKKYVLHVVPVLNPDGVALGNHRTDAAGVNLNRVYSTAKLEGYPTVSAAAEACCLAHAHQGGLRLYLDLHAHSTRRGAFLLSDQPRARRVLGIERSFAHCLARRSSSLEYSQCDFKDTTIGTAKSFITYKTGANLCFTLESHYHRGYHSMQAFTPTTWRGIGRSCLEALLDADWEGHLNPRPALWDAGPRMVEVQAKMPDLPVTGAKSPRSAWGVARSNVATWGALSAFSPRKASPERDLEGRMALTCCMKKLPPQPKPKPKPKPRARVPGRTLWTQVMDSAADRAYPASPRKRWEEADPSRARPQFASLRESARASCPQLWGRTLEIIGLCWMDADDEEDDGTEVSESEEEGGEGEGEDEETGVEGGEGAGKAEGVAGVSAEAGALQPGDEVQGGEGGAVAKAELDGTKDKEQAAAKGASTDAETKEPPSSTAEAAAVSSGVAASTTSKPEHSAATGKPPPTQNTPIAPGTMPAATKPTAEATTATTAETTTKTTKKTTVSTTKGLDGRLGGSRASRAKEAGAKGPGKSAIDGLFKRSNSQSKSKGERKNRDGGATGDGDRDDDSDEEKEQVLMLRLHEHDGGGLVKADDVNVVQAQFGTFYYVVIRPAEVSPYEDPAQICEAPDRLEPGMEIEVRQRRVVTNELRLQLANSQGWLSELASPAVEPSLGGRPQVMRIASRGRGTGHLVPASGPGPKRKRRRRIVESALALLTGELEVSGPAEDSPRLEDVGGPPAVVRSLTEVDDPPETPAREETKAVEAEVEPTLSLESKKKGEAAFGSGGQDIAVEPNVGPKAESKAESKAEPKAEIKAETEAEAEHILELKKQLQQLQDQLRAEEKAREEGKALLEEERRQRQLQQQQHDHERQQLQQQQQQEEQERLIKQEQEKQQQQQPHQGHQHIPDKHMEENGDDKIGDKALETETLRKEDEQQQQQQQQQRIVIAQPSMQKSTTQASMSPESSDHASKLPEASSSIAAPSTSHRDGAASGDATEEAATPSRPTTEPTSAAPESVPSKAASPSDLPHADNSAAKPADHKPRSPEQSSKDQTGSVKSQQLLGEKPAIQTIATPATTAPTTARATAPATATATEPTASGAGALPATATAAAVAHTAPAPSATSASPLPLASEGANVVPKADTTTTKPDEKEQAKSPIDPAVPTLKEADDQTKSQKQTDTAPSTKADKSTQPKTEASHAKSPDETTQEKLAIDTMKAAGADVQSTQQDLNADVVKKPQEQKAHEQKPQEQKPQNPKVEEHQPQEQKPQNPKVEEQKPQVQQQQRQELGEQAGSKKPEEKQPAQTARTAQTAQTAQTGQAGQVAQAGQAGQTAQTRQTGQTGSQLSPTPGGTPGKRPVVYGSYAAHRISATAALNMNNAKK